MRFKGLTTRPFITSLIIIAQLLAIFCTFTYAENRSQPREHRLEAWQKALLYSKDHPIIAFAIYGRTVDASAKENAQKIKRFFERKNIPSHYFLADEDSMGSSIGFYIQGVPYGPIGLAKAKPLLLQVIAHYQEEFPRSS